MCLPWFQGSDALSPLSMDMCARHMLLTSIACLYTACGCGQTSTCHQTVPRALKSVGLSPQPDLHPRFRPAPWRGGGEA